MEYIDYMWIKFGVFCFIAFIIGLAKGLTGRSGQGQSDKPSAPPRD